MNKNLTELENEMLKVFRQHQRLSARRDVYTIPQAAFRLNFSRNDFDRYRRKYKIKVFMRGGARLVPASEIERAALEMEKDGVIVNRERRTDTGRAANNLSIVNEMLLRVKKIKKQ